MQGFIHPREVCLTGRIRFNSRWLFIPCFEVEVKCTNYQSGRDIGDFLKWRKVKATDKLGYEYTQTLPKD